MTKTQEDYDQKRLLSLQLFKAQEIYNADYNDKEIVDEINKYAPEQKGKISVTPEVLTKCKYFHRGDHKYNVHLKQFKRIVDFVLKLLKDKYKATWDAQTESFVVNNNDEHFDSKKTDTESVKWIAGTWMGYAWNKLQSYIDGCDVVNIFGLKIEFDQGNAKILCPTQKLKFEKGSIKKFLEGRLMIELDDEKRKIIMMNRIDKVGEEFLMTTESLELGYIDSGPETVRVGLVLLERISESEFEAIKPGSKKISKFDEGKQAKLRNLLANTQLLIGHI